MAMTKARGPPSVADAGAHSASINGQRKGSISRAVATSPPWAKDEPESPLFNNYLHGSERSPRPSGTSATHVPSTISDCPSISTKAQSNHHRWDFALPRSRPKSKRHRSPDSSSSQSAQGSPTPEKQPQPSSSRRPRWPGPRKRAFPETPQTPQFLTESTSSTHTSHSEALRLELPLPEPKAPFTLSHNKTPGWDSPWTPRIPEQAHANRSEADQATEMGVPLGRRNIDSMARSKEAENSGEGNSRPWRRRKKNLRSFLLHNNYVPLVSRILNITFTTVALALAIRIRIIEQQSHVRGAVGSSPVLAIIFSPLALTHVMIAIYLEYFGRPLGLWRTSAKLAHTLTEVVFICTWSAEVALCIDNYFTSPLHCAPQSAVKWYSELPPVTNPFGNNATGDLEKDAHTLCAYQVDLIAVVMVTLLLYITNLVISLFRIFEKVKVHQGWGYTR